MAKKSRKVWWLVAGLVVVVAGNVLLVGALSGWFGGSKVEITKDCGCETGNKCVCALLNVPLSKEKYEEKASSEKAFVVLVDQSGCKTAEKLKEFADTYASEHQFNIFVMKFSDVKESSLGESVKYYPSVAIVSQGKPVAWLRADSDDDAPAYNNYDDFERWMDERIK